MDNKALKIGIISGIITSLVVIIFINPTLSLIWRVTVAVAGSIQQGYVDRIDKNAASSEMNLVGQLTFLAVLDFGIMIAMFVVFDMRYIYPRFFDTGLEKAFRYVTISVRIVVSLLLVTLIVAFSITAGIAKITASFTQRLTILAPAIDDAEYKTLKAQWAS